MKRKIYLFAMLLIASMASVALQSCGDDEESSEYGGQNVSTDDLIGKSFSCKTTSYTDYDGVPYKEGQTNTITFKSSTACERYAKGYDYIWDDGYKKSWWNHTYSCTYTVSGSTITIYGYDDFGSKSFTYTGSSLVCGTDVFE